MNDILLGVGRKLKQIRKAKKMILSEVAAKANVSAALVSKVENGRTIPSLPVLITLVQALNEDLSNFFRDIILNADKSYFNVRKSERVKLEKEESAGYEYELIFNKQLLSIGFEAVLLKVLPGAQREKTVTDAFEFKYMLSGVSEYVIGNDTVVLQEGDSIYFDGRIPHKPQNKTTEIATMLVLYFYLNNPNNQ